MPLKKASPELFKVHICCTVKKKKTDIQMCLHVQTGFQSYTPLVQVISLTVWSHHTDSSVCLPPLYFLLTSVRWLLQFILPCQYQDPVEAQWWVVVRKLPPHIYNPNQRWTLCFSLPNDSQRRTGQCKHESCYYINYTACKLFACSEGQRFRFNHVI